MRTKILQDVIAVALEAYQGLPNFADEAATCKYVSDITVGVTHVVYDVVKTDATALDNLRAVAVTPYTDAEVDTALNVVLAQHLKGGPVQGRFIDWVKTVDWAKVIQTVIAIIAIIPKTPAPVPTV
jgi:hypothetical protein